MKSDKLPVTFGMEVESNYPSPDAISSALIEAGAASLMDPYSCSTDWQRAEGSFFSRFPEKFQFPAGWHKTSDHCGMECKFSSPTQSRKEVEKRITEFASFLRAWGINTFGNCGTHIHIGIPDWIEKRYPGTSDKARIMRLRAESAALGYIQLRSNALKAIVPPHRRENQYCRFPFPAISGNVYITPLWSCPDLCDITGVPPQSIPGVASTAVINSKTPIWALHNMFLTAKSTTIFGAQGTYSCVVDRRRYPTFEFRLFPGTGVKRDLIAYSRLVLEMFDNVAGMLEKPENLKAVEVDEPSAFAVNPYKYTITDLHAELKSPWLKKWIKATCGETVFPETDEDESPAIPEPVRCAA